MPSYYWIKLYHEILDDPKMGRLPDKLWRRTVELFLIAGDIQMNGQLPPVADIAWRLREDVEQLTLDLAQLERAGILTNSEDMYTVTNFEKRQTRMSDVERQQRSRQRKRKQSYYGHEPVTTRDIETETETETETEEDNTKGEKPSPVLPTTFDGWKEGYHVSENRNGYAGRMLIALYPYYKGHKHKPNYGMLGSMLKKNDADYVLSLIFQHSARPPVGDPIKFIAGILKKNPGPAPPKEQKKRTIVPIMPDGSTPTVEVIA